ncbi:MAG: hypothetical protein FOGNACKC_01975 [Anaerolineae bacterium]|nr:hypothetical protein [Anaerolineae bacterium]
MKRFAVNNGKKVIVRGRVSDSEWNAFQALMAQEQANMSETLRWMIREFSRVQGVWPLQTEK